MKLARIFATILTVMLLAVGAQLHSAHGASRPQSCHGKVELFKLEAKDGNGSISTCYDASDGTFRIGLSGDLEESDSNEQVLETIKGQLEYAQARRLGLVKLTTIDGGGGSPDLHTDLIKSIQLNCSPRQSPACRIETEMQGDCRSACELLHLSCQKNFSSFAYKTAKLKLHCTYSMVRGKKVCDSWNSIRGEYDNHCRSAQPVDPERKRDFYSYVNASNNAGYYSTVEYFTPAHEFLARFKFFVRRN